MFLIKCRPLVALAVQWQGDNIQQVYDLCGKNNINHSPDRLVVVNNYGDELTAQLNDIIIKHGDILFVVNQAQFFNMFDDYLNPYEHYLDPNTDERVEIKDNRPDLDFMEYMI